MKIGLLTYHISPNIGAILQTYATCKALRQLGHDVVIVDIRQPEKTRTGLSGFMVKCFYSQRDKKIASFIDSFYPKMTRRYMNMEELKQDPPEVDCLLVGSDQTWNPAISKDVAMAYFLDFGKNEVKRISYASSFGVAKWQQNEEMTKSVYEALHRMNRISVREKTGVEVCKESFGLEATQVLDPTLLFDNYKEITDSCPQKNELLCYKLDKSQDFFGNIGKIIKSIGLPARFLNNSYPFKGFRYTYPPSVREWIERIGGAKFVITDSFHGTAFSLLYERQFVAIKIHNGLDSRFVDLLTELGLENRVFDSVDQMSNTDSWKEPIDYSKVRPRLEKLRHDSWEYLINSLSNNNGAL